MNEVRHLPVAEQYPSSTSMVSRLASKRISGMPTAYARKHTDSDLSLAYGWNGKGLPGFPAPAKGCIAARREVFMSSGFPLCSTKKRPLPFKVWPHFFASNCSFRCLFDLWATFCWYGPRLASPLRNKNRTDVDGFRQLRRLSSFFDVFAKFHGDSLALRETDCKRYANIFVRAIAFK